MTSRTYMRNDQVMKASRVTVMVAPMIRGPASSSGFDGGGGGPSAFPDMIGEREVR